jgi:DNA polymerase III delta prime subunit
MVERRSDNPAWVEAYRPSRVEDVILPARLRESLLSMLRLKDVATNMLFHGGPGTGKTTVALAITEEIGADRLVINGSLRGNIDTLRVEIMDFASSVSFGGGRKFVILDEADHLTHATQPALRNFMEEFSENCGFILTANQFENIIPPLKSRCVCVDFAIPRAERDALKGASLQRVVDILDTEGVSYDPRVVATIVQRYFPDLRRTLNELQYLANFKKIDAGALSKSNDLSIPKLVGLMRDKNFTDVRKMAAESGTDPRQLYRSLFETAHEFLEPESIPQLVILIEDYIYRLSFSADPEINVSAFLARAMCECRFLTR